MARISLRTYIHEIEELIDHGQIDQAIAHCRHILKYYPKHVDAYRMLGKAYLESQRYGDAADIFQRVISSVPEDFVAHLGMSIVREDEGNLDDAIWHMERAFEVQPANAAVQGELRRLYGRRDGIEPPKVRLTRGALARMYVKGELYSQAIAELRAGLNEDAQRLDLQALLARAYFLGGQRVEAAEMCSAIIKKLPYCLDANQILADILSKTERVEEAKAYAQRVHALNPYSAFISATTPTLDKVPDSAVTIEKLDWKQAKSSLETGSQPEWASSLGVQVGELSPTNEPLPDWLSGIASGTESTGKLPTALSGPDVETGGEEFTPPAGVSQAPSAAAPIPADEAIPEWMKEAGWKPSSGETREEPGSVFEFESEEPVGDVSAAPAEIPEWLRSMAPEKGEDETPISGVESKGPIPAWLDETPPGPTDSIVTWLEEKSPQPAAEAEVPLEANVDIPDWLQEMDDQSPAEEARPEAEFETEIPAESALPPLPEDEFNEGGTAFPPQPSEEIPDWLKDLQPESPGRAEPAQAVFMEPIQEEKTPAQTKELKEEPAETSAPEAAIPAEPVPTQVSSGTGITDWLKELSTESTPQPTEEPAPEEKPGEAASVTGITDWLKGLQSESAEKADMEPAPVAEVPDWLKELEPEQVERPEPVEELPAEEAPAESLPADEVPDWLKELEPEPAEQPEPVEELPAEETPVEAAPAAELPDWIKELQAEAPEMEEPVEESPLEELPFEAAPAQELPDWLAGLPVEPGVMAEPVEEVPVNEVPLEAAPAEALPDWLQELKSEAAPEAEPAEEFPGAGLPVEGAPTAELPTEETPAEAGALPDWLKELKPEEAESQAPFTEMPAEIASADAISQWLQGLPQTPVAADEAGQVPPEGFLHIEEPPPVEGDTKPSRIVQPQPTVTPPAEAVPETPSEMYPTEEAVEEPFPGIPAAEPESPVSGLPEWLTEFEETAEEAATVEMEAQTPPAEAVPTSGPQSDEEAGFAWLESLAAKQGADEALLLTPEERIETTPDWIKQEMESAAPPEAAVPTGGAEAVPLEVAPESELIAAEAAEEFEITEEPVTEVIPEAVLDETPLPEKALPFAEQEAPEAELVSPVLEEEMPAELLEAAPEMEAAPGVSDLETGPALEEAAPQTEEAAEELPEWLREPQVQEAKPVEAPALSDEDAAFAWLESLAVKQGAEEALLMRPEDRPEEVPPWVQEQVKKETGELKQPEIQLPEWLLENAPQAEAATPTERAGEIPEWLQAGEAAPVSQETPPIPLEISELEALEVQEEVEPPAAVEAELSMAEEALPVEPAAEEVPPIIEETAPAYLEEAPPEEIPVEEAAQPIAVEAVPELPSWLAEMEKAPSEEEEPTWIPPEEAAPEPAVQEAAPEAMGETPREKLNLNTAGLVELERLPGVGFIRAQSIINHRTSQGAFNSLDELSQVNGFDTTLAAELSQWLFIETVRPAIESALHDYSATLIQARNALLQGDLTEGLVHYNNLIKTRQTLPEVIQDLHEALYRFPIDITIWQSLGDAYARNGQIQDALNAYTKAEELLR